MTAGRILRDGRPAPHLWVVFVCPACHTKATCDAHQGVPLHPCRPGGVVMVGERIADGPPPAGT